MPQTKLTVIPGIGKNMEQHLKNIGITCVEDLRGTDPDYLYARSTAYHCCGIDRCVLYVYRLAVYYANNRTHEPEKLKWWNWKDRT